MAHVVADRKRELYWDVIEKYFAHIFFAASSSSSTFIAALSFCFSRSVHHTFSVCWCRWRCCCFYQFHWHCLRIIHSTDSSSNSSGQHRFLQCVKIPLECVHLLAGFFFSKPHPLFALPNTHTMYFCTIRISHIPMNLSCESNAYLCPPARLPARQSVYQGIFHIIALALNKRK